MGDVYTVNNTAREGLGEKKQNIYPQKLIMLFN